MLLQTFLFGSEDLKLYAFPIGYTIYKRMVTPFYSMVWCLLFPALCWPAVTWERWVGTLSRGIKVYQEM